MDNDKLVTSERVKNNLDTLAKDVEAITRSTIIYILKDAINYIEELEAEVEKYKTGTIKEAGEEEAKTIITTTYCADGKVIKTETEYKY